MFETSDASGGWDGTVNGLSAADGVYVYYLELFCPGEPPTILVGDIALIR